MANYNVDIGVKVKAGQLTNFNRVLDKTQERINAVNKNIQRFASLSPKHIKPVTQSFNDLTMMVNKANAAFNKSTLGTPQAADAARNLVRANEQLNIGYEKRARLLQQVTLEMKNQKLAERGIKPRTMYSGPIGPGQATSAFTGRVQANVVRSQEIREIVAAGSNRAKLGGGFKEFNKHAKKIQADTKKISTIVAQNQAQGIQAFGNQAYSQPIGPVRPGILGRLGIGTGANPRGMFANPRGRSGRVSGAISNALIGGGFPLLFGQGALGAAGGGAGGAAGGALGGAFGFGLSIAGTAIAQRIQEGREFEKQVSKINAQIQAAGGTATYTTQNIKELAKALKLTKDETMEAIQSFEAFDTALRNSLLLTFGDEETFNLIKGLKTSVDLLKDIDQAESKIGREEADRLKNLLKTESSLEVQLQLQKAIMVARKKELTSDINKVGGYEEFMAFGGNLGIKWINAFDRLLGREISQEMLDAENETGTDFAERRLKNYFKNIEEETKLAIQQLDEEFQRAFNEKMISRIAIVRDEIEELIDPITRVASVAATMGDAFGESFKGLVKGSMTAQQALANLFQRTADHFLDMAAKMIAKQIEMSVLGIGFKFIGQPDSLSNTFSNRYTADFISEDFKEGLIPFVPFDAEPKANGGPVTRGGNYLVGERGPELFSPNSSGMITPNHALGGATVVVNVDASGTSVEGNEANGEELGRLIGAVVQSELIKEKRPGGLLS